MSRSLLPLLILSACAGSSTAAPARTPVEDEGPVVEVPRAARDDVDGLVRELEMPARRAEAIEALSTLYSDALAQSDGDRTAERPARLCDLILPALTTAYLAEPSEPALQLLREMRDARAWPALRHALERGELENAITAARTIEVTDGLDEAAATAALGTALGRVTGASGIENRLFIHAIRALGSLGHPDSVPILSSIAERFTAEQNFLINRLALEALVDLADARALPVMLRGLFHFGLNNPLMRMNDVAAAGLVRLGPAVLEPLRALLRGENQEANAIVTRYLEAVRARDAETASRMSVEALVAGEAGYALGQLGHPGALDALLAETQRSEPDRRLAGAVALVSLQLPPDGSAARRAALVRVLHETTEPMQRAQLVVAMQHVYEAAILPTLLAEFRRTDNDVDTRILSSRGYALLANRREARTLRALIARERDEDNRTALSEYLPALDAAQRCDEDVACWIDTLDHSDAIVARKAAYMLARLGVGRPEVEAALIAHLDHEDVSVRGDVFYALDHVAITGNDAAIAEIDAMEEREEGRSIWTQVRDLASMVRARLRMRAPAREERTEP